jgi:hypothetical protein
MATIQDVLEVDEFLVTRGTIGSTEFRADLKFD